ncbi:hypothetical protein BH11ARM2_BH11ARM2_05490 [soil metagenome]
MNGDALWNVEKGVNTGRASSLKTIVPLVGALLYGASPLDLIPDVIPLIGWIDDAFIVPLLLFMAYKAYRRNQELVPARQRVIVHPPRG